jgi:ADP-heptose:LPS heptosyltransferase
VSGRTDKIGDVNHENQGGRETPYFKPMVPRPGDKVLWIRFSAFGDVLQAAAAAQRFKLKYPDVRLTFLTRPAYSDILEVQPYIDNLILWNNKKRPLDFFKIVREIRGSGFKWLFSMHRGTASALVALSSGIPMRFGYNGVLQSCYKSTHWERLDAMDVDFVNRDRRAIFTSESDRESAASMLSGLPEKKLLAVIGASKPQKFWPIRHWIEFLSPLVSEGWGIILSGHGEKEERSAREIEDALRAQTVLNLAGRAGFKLLAALAEVCTVAVGNDTGPLHLAALTGTPTMGFFGVTDAHAMKLRMPWFREVKVNCPNAGCWNYHCPRDCMADISSERALRAFRAFIRDAD